MKQRGLILGICLMLMANLGCDPARMSDGSGNRDADGQRKLQCADQLIPSVLATFQSLGEDQKQDGFEATMTAFTGSGDAVENYGYIEPSANLQSGPTLEPGSITHFMYRHEGKSYLNIIIKAEEGRTQDKTVFLRLVVLGNTAEDLIQVSDEHFELERDRDSNLNKTTYLGEFDIEDFTDGAVIGPFEGNAWSVELEYNLKSAKPITQLRFADAFGNIGVMGREETRPRFDLRAIEINDCQL